MKSIKSLIICLALFVVVPVITLPMSGCAAFGQRVEDSPRGNYFETQEIYIAAVSIAMQQKRTGKISQSVWDEKINPAIQAGNRLLDEMETAAANGEFDKLNAARSLLMSIVTIVNGGE